MMAGTLYALLKDHNLGTPHKEPRIMKYIASGLDDIKLIKPDNFHIT